MATARPSKPWRLAVPSPNGPVYKPQRSEAAIRDAVEAEKAISTADRIVVEKWEDGRWDEWLRWVRSGNTWHAE